jgi:hypothetical protein
MKIDIGVGVLVDYDYGENYKQYLVDRIRHAMKIAAKTGEDAWILEVFHNYSLKWGYGCVGSLHNCQQMRRRIYSNYAGAARYRHVLSGHIIPEELL